MKPKFVTFAATIFLAAGSVWAQDHASQPGMSLTTTTGHDSQVGGFTAAPPRPVKASIDIKCEGFVLRLDTGTGKGICTSQNGCDDNQGNSATGNCSKGCIDSQGKGSCEVTPSG